VEGGISDTLSRNGSPIANIAVAERAERRRVYGASQSYYMGDGGGIPRVRAVVSLVVRSARGLSQHQRVSRKVT